MYEAEIATGGGTEIDFGAPSDTDGLPRWNYVTGTPQAVADEPTNISGNFVVLFNDAEIGGRVTRNDDGDVADGGRDNDGDDDPVVGFTVELRRCTTTNGATTACTAYGQVETRTTDAEGNWEARDLMDGYWEIEVERPSGFNYDPGSSNRFVTVIGERATGNLDLRLVGPVN